MNFLKRLTAGVSALALCAGMAVSGIAGAIPANAADDTNDDWLHAVGSRLYDKDGNEVWLTGANWFGFNCTECALHYLWSGDINDMVKAIADHGINVLRIPVSTELLYNWMIGDPDPMQSVNPNNDPYYPFNIDLINPDGSVMNSMQCFDVLLKKCKQYGVKVFIDIHSPESNNSGHNYGLWYGKGFTGRDGKDVMVTTDVWIETLAWTADHYKNDDTLIGFDLKNEPHSKYGGAPIDAIWDDSDAPNNWKKASQDCASAIMEKNPNALIFIEGVEGYQGHGAWWGGNLRGVADYPVDIGEHTSQIVYSPHDYGPIVSAQTWFEKNFTEQTLLDDYWYDTWAYVNDKDIAPLLIGEWGGRIPETVDEEKLLATDSNTLDDTEKNVKWMILLRNYMINNHINHTFWCLNDDSGDTGGLWKQIGYNPSTGTTIEWDETKYDIFEPSLWQTSKSGKYISLDHVTPLGGEGSTNSITVADFYANYASSEGSNLAGGGSTAPVDPIPVETNPPVETTEPAPEPSTEPEPVASETVPPTTSTTVYGDVDEDGDVDIVDVLRLNQYLLSLSEVSTQGQYNADVDNNGIVQDADAMNILKSLVGLVSLPVSAK